MSGAFLLFGPAKNTFAYNLQTNQSADVVIGQPNFTSGDVNQGNANPAANTLNAPHDVYSDGTKLFIGDRENNRVLIYNTIPTSNNASADVVIGQADFTGGDANRGGDPAANTLDDLAGVFSDGTRLFISDNENNRLLIYNTIPTTNNASADVVVGQADFTSNDEDQGGDSAANTQENTHPVWTDGTRLIISEWNNNRVLIYNTIPTTNNASADVVIGQPDFNSDGENQGGSVGANTIKNAAGVCSDGTRLIISDCLNNRVLIYNTIPTTNHASADVVIGQADFTSGEINQTGQAADVAANTLHRPHAVYTDGTRLFIADEYNKRILIYNTIPTTNNASADVVIGQPDFTSNDENQGGDNPAANTLSRQASGVFSDGTRLFIADHRNNRVLIYNIAQSSSSAVTKAANRERVTIGDVVTYTISITNNETDDFEGVKVSDTIPSGFKYLAGSSLKNGAALSDPAISGRNLTFTLGTVEANATTTLSYQLAVGGGVQTGERYLNTCYVTDSTGTLNISATVNKGVYVSALSLLDTIIGKVFEDKDKNGVQDAGELGIPDVDIYTEDGIKITTDMDGKYHLPIAGEEIPTGRVELTKVLKLDRSTLPEGYELTTEESRLVNLSDGLLAKVNFGVCASESTSPDSARPPPVPFFDKEDFFLVGIVDGEISYREVSGNLEPVSGNERYESGFFEDGRIAYYLKGKIKGKYLVTSSFDSERHHESYLFRNLDPDRYYPVYGDSATIDYQANNTQGKLYLLIEWDESSAFWGNYITPLNQTELAKYIRTLYGGKVDYKSVSKTEYGDPVTRLILFHARAFQLAAHNEFLSTGGSLYYLNHKEITEGSEKLRLEIRDIDTNLVLETVYLTEENDYTIDYSQGMLHFSRPISMIAASGSLISSELLSGNPVYIVADYEYESSSLIDESTYGVRVAQSLGDHLTVGFTGLEEGKIEGEDYQLLAGDLTLKLKENTKFSCEYAATKREQVDSLISYDGGLTFNDLNTTTTEEGDAYSIKFNSRLGEWFNREENFLNLSAYYERISAGFSSSGTVQAQGSKRYGTTLGKDLSEKDTVRVSYDVREIRDTGIQNTISLAETPLMQATRADKYSTVTAQLTHTEENWNLGGEFRHEEGQSPKGMVGDEEADTVAVRAGMSLSEQLDVFVKQQVTIRGNDNNQTSLGLSAEVMDDVVGCVEQVISNNGGATQVRLEKNVSEDNSYYLAQTFASNMGEKKSTLSLGQKGKLNENTNIYTEDQYVTSSLEQEGSSYNKVVGINTELGDGLSADLNYQRSSFDKEEIISRQTGSVGVRYLNEELIEFAGRLELRKDRGTENKNQFLSYNKLKYYLCEDATVLGEYNYSLTRNETAELDDARYQEIAIGAAYRPIYYDRLNLLFKYIHSTDQRPLSLTDDTKDLTKSHVVSTEIAYDMTKRLQLIEEFAFRRRKSRYGEAAVSTSDTYLWINRFNYHLTNKWDVGLEGRILTCELTDDQKVGYLFEISRAITPNIWITAGYDFSEFTDDLNSANDYQSKGPFLRFQGKY
jgi:uncharacterized repeat protein (TIGR01451 family)